MRVSIIIPFKEWNEYVGKCVDECISLEYEDFEIILVPDREIDFKHDKVRVLVNDQKPSAKRNLAAKEAKGGILAFIDSDAYPSRDWLKNGVNYFREDIGIIGGPNLTPPEDGFWQKLSGDILASRAMGNFSLRYREGKKKDVKELPSCNLFVRKEDFFSAGGFDENLLTGEDSKLCFEIKEKLNKRIVYAPDVIVYHHRRKYLIPHLKQIFIYGRDKAKLFKEKRRFFYTLPSLFVLYLVFGFIVSLFNNFILSIYSYSLLFYLVIVGLFSIRWNVFKWIFIFIGVILTHITYGIGFIKGLIK